MAIQTCSLQSGSNGNCIYVETPDARLLFDAGISGKTAQERLQQHGRDIRRVDAVIISHNHSDHTRCAGIFHRKFDLPVYMTRGAFGACGFLGSMKDVRSFQPAETLLFNSTAVHTVPTAHDGIDGVAFVIESAGKKLGIFTDLGHPFAGIENWISSLDALYLESNYDPQMLAEGPYPRWLQNRIRGLGGHLSNLEAASLVQRCAAATLQFLILAHLSEHNNRPQLALDTARGLLPEKLPVFYASRDAASDLHVIR
jgi:phosphoribosyl 1,2-cyclic phosphodiesterase